MPVAKGQRKEKARKNRTKEGPRTRVRTSGKTNSLLASPVYTGKAQGEGKTHTDRGDKIELRASLLSSSFGWACPRALKMYFPLLAK